MNYLEYFDLNWHQKCAYQLAAFFKGLGSGFVNFFTSIPKGIKYIGTSIGKNFEFAGETFKNGDLKMRLSFLILGLSNFMRGQIVKGLIFLVLEIGFLYYMITTGASALVGLFTLGTQTQHFQIVEGQVPKLVPGDNSMLLLLYGVLALVVLAVFIAIYFFSLRIGREAQKLDQAGEHLPTIKEELQQLMDQKFHITLLILPSLGVFLFTVLPVVFMIAIAFTNYDADHQVPGHLFHWAGLYSFKGLMASGGLLAASFWPILGWTLIWAVLSTVSNYIFGMFLAMLINKKGIRFKGFFRTIFVLTVAIPQFVTLLVMRNMLDDHGPINSILMNLGWIHTYIPFLSSPMMARVFVLIVNLWIGMPYTMLITSGILMNIPEDLYEAARIDGATKWLMFRKITLPYMMFVTMPYLITQFIGNINNFNVIYLLTGGGPTTLSYYQAGKTDLLVTWLYKLTVNTRDYTYASAIGIIVFIISMLISLTTYHRTTSYKDEEAFQ